MDVLDDKTVIARKEHRCDYCCNAIAKGETYRRSTIKADYLYTWKAHQKCHKFAGTWGFEAGFDGGEGIPPFYDWDVRDLPKEAQAEFHEITKTAKSEAA